MPTTAKLYFGAAQLINQTPAVISGTATGQYTDGNGDTWDYYTFTASGTLTVTQEGLADVLIASGGGGRGGNYPGGGGAGALVTRTMILESGSYPLVIGALGANGSGGAFGSSGGTTIAFGLYMVGGGGGGFANQGTFYTGRGGASGGGGNGASNNINTAGGTGTWGGNGGASASGWWGGAGGGAGGNASGGTQGPGIVSSITGVTETYCAGGRTLDNASVGSYGCGSGQVNGGSGVVIVRVKV